MVVFGGYMHKHKEEEVCYDKKIYIYHLGCHVWVSQHLIESSEHFFSGIFWNLNILFKYTVHFCVKK